MTTHGVYLLHRTTQGTLPVSHHAEHYLGSSTDLASRIAAHRSGNGSRLVTVWNEAGAEWVVARVWPTSFLCERGLESKLKGRRTHNGKRSGGKNNRRLCPICHGGEMVGMRFGGARVYSRPQYRKAAVTMMKRSGRWDAFAEFNTDDGRYGLVFGQEER